MGVCGPSMDHLLVGVIYWWLLNFYSILKERKKEPKKARKNKPEKAGKKEEEKIKIKWEKESAE